MPVSFVAMLTVATLATANGAAGTGGTSPAFPVDPRWLLFDAVVLAWALGVWLALRRRRPQRRTGPRWHPPRGPLGPLPRARRQPALAASDARAWKALRRRRPERALPLLAAVLRSGDGQAWHWYHLGLAQAGLGRPDEAVAAFQRALQQDPGHYAACFNAAALEAERGRTAEAIRLYHEALAMRPDAAEVHFNLGHAYFALRLYEVARHHWREAKRLAPRDLGARHNLKLLEKVAPRAPHAPSGAGA